MSISAIVMLSPWYQVCSANREEDRNREGESDGNKKEDSTMYFMRNELFHVFVSEMCHQNEIAFVERRLVSMYI